MPPPRPVTGLQQLCIIFVADHIFNIFSSWHRCNDIPDYNRSLKPGSKLLSKDYKGKKTPNPTRNNKHDSELLSSSCDCEDNETIRGEKIQGVAPIIKPETNSLVEQLRDYLSCCVPPTIMEIILQTLLNKVARKDIPKPLNVWDCEEEFVIFIRHLGFLLKLSLTCLLIEGVKSLDLFSLSHLVNCGIKIYHSRRPRFDIFNYAFSDSVPGLEMLKYLRQPHLVQGSFICKIGFLCPNLEVLVLRCSDDCYDPEERDNNDTDIGALYGSSCGEDDLDKPRGCLNLTSLVLPYDVRITDSECTVLKLLFSMTNLKHFVGVSMLDVLEYMERSEQYLTQLGKLETFYQRKFVDADQILLPNLTEHFVNVKEVVLTPYTFSYEKVLKSFPMANTVTLYTSYLNLANKIHLARILASLTQLTSLDIVEYVAYNIGEKEFLTSLSHSCPHLEQLTLRRDYLFIPESGEAVINFPCLHTLKLQRLVDLDEKSLLAILPGCPMLSSFELSMNQDDEQVPQFDNTAFLQVLPFLYNIKKFVYNGILEFKVDDFNPALKLDSLQCLISSCPHLTHVGDMKGWDVTKEEVEALKEEARLNNWDLEIV